MDLPKLAPHESSSYRLITDIRKSGGNRSIPHDLATVQYTKFDDVVQNCLDLGPGCFLAKTDIASAFRNIPVCPQDWCWLGIKFQGKYYFDKCLPFGLSTSCRIFEDFASAIQALARARVTRASLHHYLDDFVSGGTQKQLADLALQTPMDVCQEVGLPISQEKTFWGDVIIKCLGLILDTVRQIILVPDHKIKSLTQKLLHVSQSRTVRIKTLQSLTGSLNFYARAKPGGRAFIRRLYDAQMGLPQHYHVGVTPEMKLDLRVWLQFLQESSRGMPFVDTTLIPADHVGFSTDASGDPDLGWGCSLGQEWCQGCWPPGFIEDEQPSIAWLELYALVVGTTLWAHHFTGRRIVLLCDNQSAVHIVNSQTSKSPQCMALVRKLVLIQLKYDFRLKSEYIESELNSVADALSRFQEDCFKNLCPTAHPYPSRLPESLWL